MASCYSVQLPKQILFPLSNGGDCWNGQSPRVSALNSCWLGPGAALSPTPSSLTKHAIQIGCAGALTLPPFYYKQVSDDGLFQYFASLIDGVADERLRLYLYHIPPMAIVSFSLALVEKLIAKYPGIVVGIKDSSGDWAHTKELIERFGRFAFDVFPGSESYLLAALQIGAAGCISGMTNVSAESLQMIFKNWRHPEAKARQELISRVRQTLLKYPLIPALKAIISKARDDNAWKNVRPPLLPLRESEFAEPNRGAVRRGLRVAEDKPKPPKSVSFG